MKKLTLGVLKEAIEKALASGATLETQVIVSGDEFIDNNPWVEGFDGEDFTIGTDECSEYDEDED